MFKSLKYVDAKRNTIKDGPTLKKELARLAKAWGMTVKECTEYALRMGVNRCLALERHGKVKAKAGKSKKGPKPTRKLKAKAKAKVAKTKAPKPATLNGAATV